MILEDRSDPFEIRRVCHLYSIP